MPFTSLPIKVALGNAKPLTVSLVLTCTSNEGMAVGTAGVGVAVGAGVEGTIQKSVSAVLLSPSRQPGTASPGPLSKHISPSAHYQQKSKISLVKEEMKAT